MIVYDVSWSHEQCLTEGSKPYVLRLIFDSSFERLSDNEQYREVLKRVHLFVGQKMEIFNYGVVKTSVPSDCIAYHTLNTDLPISTLLRFGYLDNQFDVTESEMVIPNPNSVTITVSAEGNIKCSNLFVSAVGAVAV